MVESIPGGRKFMFAGRFYRYSLPFDMSERVSDVNKKRTLVLF